MLTQADIDNMIQQWTRSPEGRSYLKSVGVGIYTDQEMIAIANELKLALASAFVGAQTSLGGTFDVHSVDVKLSRGKKENVILVSFPGTVLRRNSLMKYDGSYTGEGVDDIFALFTHGWHAKNYAYGSWMDAYSDDEMSTPFQSAHSRSYSSFGHGVMIRSRKDFPGSSFIQDTCSYFETKYPGLSIKLPKDWRS